MRRSLSWIFAGIMLLASFAIASRLAFPAFAGNLPGANRETYRPLFIVESSWDDPSYVGPPNPEYPVYRDIAMPYHLFIATKDAAGMVSGRMHRSSGAFRGNASVNVSDIAANHLKLPPVQAESSLKKLLGVLASNFSGDLTTEPFADETQSVLYWGCVAYERKLNLIASSPRFESFLAALPDPDAIRRRAHRVISESHLPAAASSRMDNLAWGDFTAAYGRAAGLETYAGGFSHVPSSGALHNLALYRAIQQGPKAFYFSGKISEPAALDSIRKDIAEIADLVRSARPVDSARTRVANLALDLQPSDAPLPHMIAPIVNALLAGGYQLQVTFGKLATADLHYVLFEEKSARRQFMSDLSRLLNRPDDGSRGPVILHPLGEIGRHGAGAELRARFKIPDSEKRRMPMPAIVHSYGQKIPWRGAATGGFEPRMTAIRAGQVKNLGGDPIVSQVIQGYTYALALSSGQDYLINGDALDFQASYLLSRLLGGPLLSPTSAYVSVSPEVIAILSPVETDLHIRIPVSAPSFGGHRLIRFGADGRKVRDESVSGAPVFECKLAPWELLLLVPSRREIAPALLKKNPRRSGKKVHPISPPKNNRK